MARNKPRKTRKKSPPASARPAAHTKKQAGKPKRAGRIPGVSVGDEVNTSLGEKKKVCFNIGGKWFFRMVDPDWRAPGRPLKKAKSIEHGAKSGKPSKKSEVRGRKTEVKGD